jgi:hypothetical protein
MLDLVPLRCDVKANTIDSDETLMEINITGSAALQKSIRLLCSEYKNEPASRVPPLSMKVALDK